VTHPSGFGIRKLAMEMSGIDGVRGGKLGAIGLILLLSSCAPAPTAEDKKAIEGLWRPEDGSAHEVSFGDTGVFDYQYNSNAVLELGWELRTKGKLVIKATDGAVVRTCYYTIEAGTLTIDDGARNACIEPAVTPHEPMPQTFHRAP
jgi:hypothetical protein